MERDNVCDNAALHVLASSFSKRNIEQEDNITYYKIVIHNVPSGEHREASRNISRYRSQKGFLPKV